MLRIGRTEKPLADNLVESEVYCKTAGFTGEHDIDEGIVKVISFVKQLYGKLWITSTFRDPVGNALAGGVKNSPHLKGYAVDWRPADQKRFLELQEDLKRHGDMFDWLTGMGVVGIGLYDNFIHLDTAPWRGKVVEWDYRKKKVLTMAKDAVTPGGEMEDSAHELGRKVRANFGVEPEIVVAAGFTTAFALYLLWRTTRRK